jgi:hypothetical protein
MLCLLLLALLLCFVACEWRSPKLYGSALQDAAQAVQLAATAAAAPEPPTFEPMSLDVLPQRYWQPTFLGCPSAFTEEQCDYAWPAPRLRATDLDELYYLRSLESGRENLVEPLRARQALAQLLTLGTRSRRDVYTQASGANDVQSVCAKMRGGAPEYVPM